MKKIIHTLILITVFFICFSCKLEELPKIDPCLKNLPIASFSPSATSCDEGCEINLSNNSSPSTGLNFKWSFGDGRTSTQANPSKIRYDTAGSYSITLIATNDLGCSDTASTTINIKKAAILPVAEFMVDLSNNGGFAPCSVKFINTTKDATQFYWEFGDGSTSKENAPSHKFLSPGDYIVKLTATGFGGTDIETKLINIKTITFVKTLGGTTLDYGFCVEQTDDDGYIVAGSTRSEGAGGEDVYLVKTDLFGKVSWKSTFGGSKNDRGYSVQQTKNGEYIITGSTDSKGLGNSDVYKIKTPYYGFDSTEDTYGGAGFDQGNCIQQTSDGGFILVGYTTSEGLGGKDILLMKFTNGGTVTWKKTYGTNLNDEGLFVQETSDGGYVVCGYTLKSGSSGEIGPLFLMKTDNSGKMIWESKAYGNGSSLFCVRQTTDGGLIIVGTGTGRTGLDDVQLIKTDHSGNVLWSQKYGGNGIESGRSVDQTADGGYIIAGYTDSKGAGNNDLYLIKTNKDGKVEWEKTFGGSIVDQGFFVRQARDGGYIVVGYTNSFEMSLIGSFDVLLIKTDKLGNVQK